MCKHIVCYRSSYYWPKRSRRQHCALVSGDNGEGKGKNLLAIQKSACFVLCAACEGRKNATYRTESPRQQDEDEIRRGKRMKLGSGDSGFYPAVQDRGKSTVTVKQTADSAKLLANSCEPRRSSRQIQPTRKLLEGLEIQSMERTRKRSAG